MEDKKQSLGLKVHNLFKNKINPSVKAGASSLASGIAEGLRKKEMLESNVRKTLQDIPAIMKTEAVTWGPKVLDAGNDYISKPLARNIKGLVTGDDTINENSKIDQIADDARAYEKDFYKNHDFKQGANKKYGETLGNVLIGGIETLATTPMAAPKALAVVNKLKPGFQTLVKNASTKVDDLGKIMNSKATDKIAKATSKATNEILKEVTSPKVTKEITKQMSSKVKTIDAQLKALDKIMKANKGTATPEQISKMKLAKERLLQDKDIYSNYSGFTAFYKKLQQARVNKQVDKLLKEEGPGMAEWKKIMIGLGGTSVAGLLAAKYLGGDDNKSEGYEDNKVDVPEDFEIDMREIENALGESSGDSGSTEGGNEIDNFTTTPQNNFPVNVTGSQNGGTENSGTAKQSQNNASVSVGELYNKNGERVTLFRNGDKLQVRSPNGQVVTLATGVTDFNQGRKYTEIANTVLPF